MKSSLVKLLLAACVPFACNAQAWTLAQTQKADAVMNTVVPGGAPSATVAIAVNGTLVYAKGFGSIAPGVAPNPYTLYRVGSLSKQFTAAGVLSLAEKSRVNLDAPVSAYVPGPARWTTVRHLLNMNSGLPDYLKLPLTYPYNLLPYIATQVPAAYILQDIAALPPTGSTQFEYSNSNYFVLASVIEAASGMDYRAYLNSAVLAKAGLQATGFSASMPSGYVLAPPTYRQPPRFHLDDWPKGAGDMVANVVDFARWDFALMTGQVIGQQALATMLMPAAALPNQNPPAAYAMGEIVVQTPAYTLYTHDGEIAGYTAANSILLTPGGLLVSATVLTNGDAVSALENASVELAQIALAD